jgi:hypothetical protein
LQLYQTLDLNPIGKRKPCWRKTKCIVAHKVSYNLANCEGKLVLSAELDADRAPSMLAALCWRTPRKMQNQIQGLPKPSSNTRSSQHLPEPRRTAAVL